MGPCSIEGCDAEVRARGWCGKHYQRWRKHGDPNRVERGRRGSPGHGGKPFWGYHVEVRGDDECWPFFKNRKERTGRGQIRVRGRQITGARYAWVLTHGEIPDGKHVLHRCDFGPCCNPAHLELGDHAKNMKDAVERGLIRPITLDLACKYGHPRTPENTAIRGDGRRYCKECANGARRRRNAA